MSGDLLAAGIMFALALRKNKTNYAVAPVSLATTVGIITKMPPKFACGLWQLTKLPWAVCVLVIATLVCNIMIAVPLLPVAVFAQVVMGTVYVYGVQLSTEGSALLSHGSSKVYRKLTFLNRATFDVACSLANFQAMYLYENVDPVAPFYVVAMGCLVFSVVYMACLVAMTKDTDEQQRKTFFERAVEAWNPSDNCAASAEPSTSSENSATTPEQVLSEV